MGAAFLGWLLLIKVGHRVLQKCRGAGNKDMLATSRAVANADTSQKSHRMKEYVFVGGGGIIFIATLLARTSQWRWAHPISQPVVQSMGAIITLFCGALMLWAHCSLGDSWSGVPQVNDQHVLKTSGAYAWVRHPMYASRLYLMLGIALATLNWVITLGYVLCSVHPVWRIKEEEDMLIAIFPEYEAYRQRVLPFGPCLLDCYRRSQKRH